MVLFAPLDVLCFGRETLEEILGQALQDFGEASELESPVRVVEAEDDEGYIETEPWPVDLARLVTIDIPRVTVRASPPSLDFDLTIRRALNGQLAAEFRLGEQAVGSAREPVAYSRTMFVRLAAARVLAGLRYLNAVTEGQQIEALVEGVLNDLGVGDSVRFDWIEVAEAIKDQIDKRYRKQEVVVQTLSGTWQVSPRAYVAQVALDSQLLNPDTTWTGDTKRRPFGMWSRCVHDVVRFDSGGELAVARVLDRSRTVDWWLRNDPPVVRLPTTVGEYRPDFIVRLLSGALAATEMLILEVKGGHLWEAPLSDARVKAASADRWCAAVSGVGEQRWLQAVVLAADAPLLVTLEEICNARINAV